MTAYIPTPEEREEAARILFEVTKDDDSPSFDWYLARGKGGMRALEDDFFRADALFAAGYGPVDKARADAWDEGLGAGLAECNRIAAIGWSRPALNPYRVLAQSKEVETDEH